MATRSDVPEPAVDELKRRARRRLVGAIVLALAAAVLLPLLLESEPKPIGDDVLIQIPPVDNGKFINPLSSGKAPDPKMKGSAATGKNALQPPVPATPGPVQSVAPTLKGSGAGNETQTRAAGAQSGSAPVADAAPASVPATPTQTAAAEAALPGREPVPAVPAAAKPDDAAAEAKPPAAASAGNEAANPDAGYVVQIAAFSDRYGARSLASKLKRDGFPGYTEAVTTDKGTLHRVRVGPYPSREAANAALAKLKAAGFNGMIAHVG